MATASVRNTYIAFTGDVIFSQTFSASPNATSPGENDLMTLASGDNTITVPTSGTVPTAVTIIPPTANAVNITLKGAGGDTGIALNLTNHTSIALKSTQANFILNASATLTGLRLIWT